MSFATNVVLVAVPTLGKSNRRMPDCVEILSTLSVLSYQYFGHLQDKNLTSVWIIGPATVKNPLPCGCISRLDVADAVSIALINRVDDPSVFALLLLYSAAGPNVSPISSTAL